MNLFKRGPGALICYAPDSGAGGGQEPLVPASGSDPAAPAAPEPSKATPAQAAGNVEDLPGWAQNLLKDLRKENAGHRTAKTEAEKAREDAEAKALAEQGKYKELYEKAQADQQAAQARIKAMELDALRRSVGARLGLPAALHSRLQGEDEAGLEADAQTLIAGLTPAQANGQGQPAQPGVRFPVQGTGGGAAGRVDLAAQFIAEQQTKNAAVKNPLLDR